MVIDISNRHARGRVIRMFAELAAVMYLWSAVPCAGGGQIFPDTNGLRKFHHPCGISVRNNGSVGTALIQDHVIPRLQAAVLLRDNLLTMIIQILLRCLDEESRVSFEILHDALRSRHLAVYDILPILSKIRGKSAKSQIHSVLQIIERIGSPFLSGYATIAKDFVRADPMDLNSVIKIDLLWSMANRTVEVISLSEESKFDLPITEEEAFAEVMNALGNGNVNLELSVVSALMANIPNFDVTDPEVPGSLRFVASYINEKSEILDPLLDFVTIDQLDAPDILVKTVLDRIEVSEHSSEALRESVGILLRSFDTKPWDLGSKLDCSGRGSATNVFDHVTPDYYPQPIVAIARYFKQQRNFEESLNVESAFYLSETKVMTEFLTKLRKRNELPQRLFRVMEPLRSFVSQRNKDRNDFGIAERPVGFHEALKHLMAFDAPCLPRKLTEAAKSLRPLLTEDLPWSFAYGQKNPSNPWKLMVMALINLRSTPISTDQASAIDNLIFHAQSSGLLGKPGVLYDDATIFQRPDSLDVELDMHSLLSRLPGVFDDERFTPLLVFATKTNFFDYLGHGFNKFEHAEPRELLLTLLNHALTVSAVDAIKPLVQAINIAKNHLVKPLLGNLYTWNELPRILDIFPMIHEDPRYLPLKILFKEKNLFSHLSPDFNLGNSKSPTEHVKFILGALALKPIEMALAESVNFALNNVDSPPLPARAFARRDFVYLVDQLLSKSNHSRLIILRSPVYDNVADWNLPLRGSPEVILSRILNYPVEELSEDLELAKTIRDVEASLDEGSVKAIDILKNKTLNAILDICPDGIDFRVIKLLFKKSKLTMIVPELNMTRLDDLAPPVALKKLLKHLANSPHMKSESLLLKHLVSAERLLDLTKQTGSSGERGDLASCLSDMLMDLSDPKFEPLIQELKNRKRSQMGMSERLRILRRTLIDIQDKSTSSNLRQIARMALAQVFHEESDYRSKEQRVSEVKMINYAIDILPKQEELDPLREFLNVDWIRGVLPADFQTSKYQKRSDLLRAILFFAKKNQRMRENGLIQRTIHLAEQAIGGRKSNVAIEVQLTPTMLRRIVHLIPRGFLYDPIRSMLTSRKIVEFTRETENWQEYPSDREKLEVLLAIIQKKNAHGHIARSLMELRRYLTSQFDFVSKKELTLLKQELYGVRGNVDLVPLKLFFTEDNLREYLPKGVNYTSDRLLNEAFVNILHVLQGVPSLKRRGSLYKAMGIAQKILAEKQMSNRGGDAGKLANSQSLTPQDLRFILALKVEDPELKSFLEPKELILTLPNSFELSGQTIFKTKAVRLLGQLIKSDGKMRNKLLQLLQRVESMPDVPLITDDDLRLLIDLIPRDTSPSFEPIKKLLRSSNLTQLFPGDFEIRSFDNPKVALKEVLKMFELTNDLNNKSLRKSILTLRQELSLKKSKILLDHASINLEELRSVIAEIPFDEHVALREVKRNFTEDKILSLLPREFNVDRFATKKSRLMGIIEAIVTSSTAGELEEPMKIILNLISEMPDAPRIHEEDIEKALSSVPLTHNDSKALMDYCNIERLGARLPIAFNVSHYKNRKQRISVLLKYCEETQPSRDDVKKALSNAMDLITKLPSLDLTNLEINGILDEINCINVSLTEPLKVYISEVDVAPLLPWNLDLENQSTFKLRIETLLKALIEVGDLQSVEYKKALKNLKYALENMPDHVRITEKDLTALREVAVMQESRSKLCSEYLTLRNVLKVVPPTFDAEKYPNSVSRLSALLLHIDKTQQIHSDQALRDSCKFVNGILSRDMEKVIIDRLKDLTNGNEKYVPLKLFLLSSKDTMFDEIVVPRGYENENVNDTLRIAMRYLLKTGKVLRSKTLSDIMVSLLGNLPSFTVTKFDVDEALAEIPKSNRYDSLRILLRCSDVMNYLRESSRLPSDCTSKRLLLRVLEDLQNSSFLDRKTVDTVEELKNEVQREIRDQEVEEAFKPLKDHDINVGKLEAAISFFAAEGLEKILGQNYRDHYPDKLHRLRVLCEKPVVLREGRKNHELQRSLDYLTRFLQNYSVAKRSQRSISDINIQSLVAALRKTRNEQMILGLVRFLSDPELLRDLRLQKNPYDYVSKGALLKAIVRKGRNLRRVKSDRLQSEALGYFKDRILAEGPGNEPIELKNYARNSNINVDTIGLLKALNSTAVNATVAVKMTAFFENEYEGLLHGVGFDQAAYATRGSYLRAFLRHLVRNSAVPDEVRLNAGLLLPAVTLVGLGAEPVDVNEEDIVSDNRMFVNQSVPDWSPRQSLGSPAISSPTHLNEEQATREEPGLERQLTSKTSTSSSRVSRQALPDEDAESATFHPDEVLYRSGDRMLLGPEVENASKDAESIIGMDEADRAPNRNKRPVTPLKVNPEELPKTVGHSKKIPHRPSKHPQAVDLVARKLFVRNGDEGTRGERRFTNRTKATWGSKIDH